MNDATRVDIDDAKRALRREMRSTRRSLPDRSARSQRIFEIVRSSDAVVGAGTVMAYASIPGEPETAEFIAWCRSQGKRVVLPEDEPAPDPRSADVVIVPGTAFTADGRRLGQGGGWYDRFLEQVRPDCVTIGVGFAPQLVDDLPTAPHDVKLDIVVTDAGRAA